jgi:hypothetical protein
MQYFLEKASSTTLWQLFFLAPYQTSSWIQQEVNLRKFDLSQVQSGRANGIRFLLLVFFQYGIRSFHWIWAELPLQVL